MEAIFMTILKGVIMVVVPVATSVLTLLAKQYVTAFIDKKTKGETAEMLKRVLNIVLDSVNYVQQTYVDELKKYDNFTKEAQEEAFDKAKTHAIELMNMDMLKAIEDSYGDINKYIDTVIESAVATNK